MAFTYEPDEDQSIHSFAEELCRVYDRSEIDIVGLYNGVILNVNEYENPRSLYWQYKYKKEVS
jgi:hypothetical protein